MPIDTPAPAASAHGAADTGLGIADVERETGLGKDVLRVWERRYGFPLPLRDAAGDRRYPAHQVQRLRLIRRLLDGGQRPGKVVPLDDETLQRLAAGPPDAAGEVNSSRTRKPATPHAPELGKLLKTIAQHDAPALRQGLEQAQLRMGLGAFIHDLVAPLTHAVGEAWAQGRFQVFEEHLFTEVATSTLRQSISRVAQPGQGQGPTVLLTTVPPESHGLGLLMVEALLALEGCPCVSLGTQTPVADIVQAAAACRADVVALSFSNAHRGTQVLASLSTLRARLPPQVQLWAGGSCTALRKPPFLPNAVVAQDLRLLPALVMRWREAVARPLPP